MNEEYYGKHQTLSKEQKPFQDTSPFQRARLTEEAGDDCHLEGDYSLTTSLRFARPNDMKTQTIVDPVEAFKMT